MRELIYLIKFDGQQPYRVVAKTYLRLVERINYEVELNQKPFEWIIRDY